MVNEKSLQNLHPFSVTRQPINRAKVKGAYLTSFLKRCLKKKISFEDPETQKIIKGRVRDALVWRYILNGTQGDNQAIEGIFDRIDGKTIQKLIGEGFSGDTKIIVVYPEGYKPKEQIADNTQTISSRLSE